MGAGREGWCFCFIRLSLAGKLSKNFSANYFLFERLELYLNGGAARSMLLNILANLRCPKVPRLGAYQCYLGGLRRGIPVLWL